MSTPLGAELEIISVTQSLKFPRFQDVPNNQLMLLLLFPTKIIPPPYSKGKAVALPFTTHRQYLNAKIQINLYNCKILAKRFGNKKEIS